MSGVLDVLAGATGAAPAAFGTGASALYGWGRNNFGQLGFGLTTDLFSSPKQVGALSEWKSISAGEGHTLAIKPDGTLWAWGNNSYGTLGLGNTTNYSSPKQVGALTTWSFVDIGNDYSLAIKTDGTLWSWGRNNQGQLGFGLPNDLFSSPKQVGALTTWSSISAGGIHALAVKTDGTLWSWGHNGDGRLGQGNLTYLSSPKQVGALTTWSSISAGSAHSLAIKTDGTLWSWGYNTYGGLGLGDATQRSSPVQVGALTTWSSISAADLHSVAIKTDGTLWSWGLNAQGQLGQGNATDLSSPKQVGALSTWSNVFTGHTSTHTIAVKTDGTLWSWGDNQYGKLGLGNTTNYSSPKQVGSLTNWGSVSTGLSFTVALTAAPKTVPDKPTNISATAGDTNATVTFTAPANGGSPITSYTVTAYTGGVSTGITTSGVTTSIKITGLTNGTAYTFTVKATNSIGTGKESDTSAVVYSKGLWSWGRNVQGNLGLGNTTYYSSPKAVGALTDWSNISTGSYHVLAIKTNGTLWSWGFNAYGGLGLGNTTYYSSPKQVGALTNWLKVTAGYRHSIGIKTDGSIWSWGGNTAGQLGLGNTTNYSSPKQVGALTTWLQVACGYYYTSAIKTDGTLWTWGRNLQGQLGLGDTTQRNSPVQVGSDSNWSKITSGVYSNNVIKTDGTLWTWGFNSDGQLGLGDTTNRSSPNQVGSGTTWSSISSKHAHCIATKIDGTLWAWGNGGSGQLGLGSLISYSSPKQVGSDTNWSNVASGGAHSIALKTNGTLWSWGRNSQGQLGLGDTTNRSSPNQVGALTTWSFISSDTNYALAFQNASNNAVTPSTRSFVDDVFSTYLYTGNGSTQTINNGIDLAGNGGMVWIKSRSAATTNHRIFDTNRGVGNSISSNLTTAQSFATSSLDGFLSSGFSIQGFNGEINDSARTYASWTFRKAAKFFDVVTWTNTSSTTVTVNHNLGVVPGMVIVKRTSSIDSWMVRHRSLPTSDSMMFLNSTAANSTGWTGYSATATTLTYDTYGNIGDTYVAYLFAHDTSSTGIIQCGSYVETTGANAVNLGWEPQYLMVKNASVTGNWWLIDTMRGMDVSGLDALLGANTANAEVSAGGNWYPTATGFANDASPGNGQTYIYMAIRRPNKPPTTGTQVFSPEVGTNTSGSNPGIEFSDVVLSNPRNGSFDFRIASKLQGVGFAGGSTKYLSTASTAAEQSVTATTIPSSATTYVFGCYDNFLVSVMPSTVAYNGNAYFFKRAPGFFDEVCYTGNGVLGQTYNHNLTVSPELIIVKARNSVRNWAVYPNTLSSGLYLNLTGSFSDYGSRFTSISSTTFGVQNDESTNFSGYTYVAYLFATLAGISKVGSYTGNGGTLTVNCGFTAGARFVLIKRTDATGDWYVWDTARSINPGNEPHLSLNTTELEVTTDDTMDYDTNGFVVNQVAATNVNVTSATYIYLAIA
jgi:alpha-tubulin suppressor-like RCC1 family protein